MNGAALEERFRVLVVAPDFPPALGGIQQLVHRVLREMPDTEARLLTLRSEGWREFDRTVPQTIARLPAVPGPPVVRNAAFNLQAVVAGLRWRPDAILGGHVVVGPACAALAKVHRVPAFCYVYGKEIWGRPSVTSWTLRHVTAGIAISDYSRQRAIETLGGAPARIEVIPPGVDSPARPGRADAERPTIVTVSRLRDWYKGHDTMLEALVEVRRQVPRVRWVVIGDGPLEGALRERAGALGLDDAVEFIGAVSDERRDSLLAGAHVFAMPSRLPSDSVGGEGFGIVYLEAASFGLPVVAGDVAGPREAVLDGETGLLVDPTDPGAVAAALARLLGDPEQARRMGMRGRERALAEFTWDEIGARVGETLRGRVQGRRD